MNLRETNRIKLKELDPRLQPLGEQWLDECFDKGMPFTIKCVYRSQEDQNRLYQQGRTRPGVIVTWTTKSLHSLRAALDITSDIKNIYTNVAKLAYKYGITHPLPGLDPGHFEWPLGYLKIVQESPINGSNQISDIMPPESRLRVLERAYNRATGAIKESLGNLIERFKKRL